MFTFEIRDAFLVVDKDLLMVLFVTLLQHLDSGGKLLEEAL
jgi:hypothetical protein